MARAEGPTFAGALIDEACECPTEMVDHMSTRTSVPHAKIVYSYFPQSTLHPLKVDNYDLVVDGRLSGRIFNLDIRDNPYNTDEYIAEQESKWSKIPHEHDRRIKGLWASASGMVYALFENHVVDVVADHYLEGVVEWTVAADWARSGVCAAILIGWHEAHGKFYVCGEWRHEGAIDGEQDTPTKVDLMIDKLTDEGRRQVSTWIIDPNEDGLRVSLNEKAPTGQVIDGVTGKEEGTGLAIEFMQSGRYVFCKTRVPWLLRDFAKQTWDRKAQAVGRTGRIRLLPMVRILLTVGNTIVIRSMMWLQAGSRILKIR